MSIVLFSQRTTNTQPFIFGKLILNNLAIFKPKIVVFIYFKTYSLCFRKIYILDFSHLLKIIYQILVTHAFFPISTISHNF